MTRELDAEVATKVMGWVKEVDPLNSYGTGHYWCHIASPDHCFDLPPRYSSDAQDAVSLAGEIIRDGWQLSVYSLGSNMWSATFRYELEDGEVAHSSISHSFSDAICRAALAAVGGAS
jgi:hypothetical protein